MKVKKNLHGAVSKLFIKIVGGSTSGFASRKRHLDPGCFCTFCLPSLTMKLTNKLSKIKALAYVMKYFLDI